MKFSQKNIPYSHALISLLIVVIMLFSTFRMAKEMRNSIGEPFNWYLLSICGAISSLEYNRGGYVCYKRVFEKLNDIIINRWYGSSQRINEVIQEALTLKDVDHGGIYTMGEMDAGYIDYCRLSFMLFGFNVQSLFYMYCLLFFVSTFIFFLTFRNHKKAIFVLMAFLLAHYATVMAGSYISNLVFIHSYRFIILLALFPLLYIVTLTLINPSFRVGTFMGGLIQSLLFSFVLWIRGSVLWGVIFLFVYFLIGVLNKWRYGKENIVRYTKIALWPILLILAVVMISKIMMPTFLDPSYKADQGSGYHGIWDSIYVGLALHPEIRENYSEAVYDNVHYGDSRGPRIHGIVCADEHMRGHPIKVAIKEWVCGDAPQWLFEIIYIAPSDQDGYSAAFKWLYDRDISEYHLFNISPEENIDYEASFHWFQYESEIGKKRKFDMKADFKWPQYDSIFKEVTLDVARHYPLQIAQNVLIDKPIRYLYVFSQYLSLRYFPFVLFPLLLFYSFCMQIQLSRWEIVQGIKLLLAVFGFSLIPIILTYPAAYAIPESALIFFMIVFIIFCNFLNTRLIRYFNKGK